MATVFTIDVEFAGKIWHNTGPADAAIGAGQWRILKRVYTGAIYTEQIVARTQNPNGWTVTFDNADTPTSANISAPLEVSEFELRTSYIQNSAIGTGVIPGYGTEVLSPSIGYTLEVFSTTTESLPIGSGGGTLPGGRLCRGLFDVISLGPLMEIEHIGVDEYWLDQSVIGRRQIVQSGNVILDRIGSPLAILWELRDYNGLTPGAVLQTGTEDTFEFDNELEPGDRYELKLTGTNSFGKVGWIRLILNGESMAAHYDRNTGIVRVFYSKDNALRVANYPAPQVPDLNSTNPAIALPSQFQAPHSIFRYGAEVYAVTSTGRRCTSLTEGHTWFAGVDSLSWRYYGYTVNADGSVFNKLYKHYTEDTIKWTNQSSELTGQTTNGLEGFRRPAELLNIGNSFLLIAKLGNDVVFSSSQNGIDWEESGVIFENSRFIGAFKTACHSIVRVMVQPRGFAPAIIELFYSGEGWEIGSRLNAFGLPATFSTPAALDSDGVITILAYTDGDGHCMAVSYDLGMFWHVVED